MTKFPKTDKHTLGRSISEHTLTLLEMLMGAGKLPAGKDKLQLLTQASHKLGLIKLLIRMCFEVKAISDKQYLMLQEYLCEIGKMLGGWTRSLTK